MSLPPYVPARDALELDLRLGKPGAKVGNDVTDGPVRIAVIAGHKALVRSQRAHQSYQLVPTATLGIDVGVVRMLERRALRLGRHADTPAKVPSSGRPASSQSISPPEYRRTLLIAAFHHVTIKRHARQAIHVRAVDDHLVVWRNCLVELLWRVEMERAGNVLGVERPAIECLDQLEIVATIELCLELGAIDRLDGSGPRDALRCGWSTVMDHRS